MIKKTVAVLSLAAVTTLVGCELGKSDEEYLASAKGFYQRENYSEAVIELKNALKSNPNNADARLLLGRIYLDQGDGPSAVKELDNARAGVSQNISSLLARAYLLVGESEKVLKLSEWELAPSELHDLRVSKGNAQLVLGNSAVAKKAFESVLRADPGNAYAQLGMARFYLIQENSEAARANIEAIHGAGKADRDSWSLLAFIERADGNMEAAEKAYSAAIEKKPRSYQDIIARAMVRISLGKLDDAESDLKSLPPSMKKLASVHYSQGLIDFQREDFDSAQLSFEKVLNSSGDFLPALFFSGASHMGLGNEGLAEEKLNRYVAKSDRFPSANRMLAQIRLKNADYSGAESLMREIVTPENVSESDHELLATALQAQGKAGEALTVLGGLVEKKPDSAMARVLLGRLLLSVNNYDRAIAEFEKSLQLKPDNLQAYAVLVQAHLGQGNPDKAHGLVDRLIGVSGESVNSNNLRAGIYLSQKDEANARQAFNMSLQIDAGDISANSGLAALAFKDKDFSAAKTHYQNILKASPVHLPTLMNIMDIHMAEDNKAEARKVAEQAVAAHPQDLSPHIRLGWFYANSGEANKISALLSGFQERFPDHIGLLVLLADGAYKMGNFAQAERYLVRLRELNPENAGIAYSLAKTHAARNNSTGYLEALGDVIGLAPENVNARIDMASYLISVNRISEAQQHIDNLEQRFPDSREVLLLKGKIADSRGDFARSVEFYRPVFEYAETNVNLLRLANAQWLAGQRGGAVQALESWLSEHQGDTPVQLELAGRYLSLDRVAESVALYKSVLQSSPDNVLAMNNLAWLLKDSDNAKAVELAESAYKQAPESADIMDTLATVLKIRGEKGDDERAERLIERAEAAKKK